MYDFGTESHLGGGVTYGWLLLSFHQQQLLGTHPDFFGSIKIVCTDAKTHPGHKIVVVRHVP